MSPDRSYFITSSKDKVAKVCPILWLRTWDGMSDELFSSTRQRRW
jgi:hypothetical protein